MATLHELAYSLEDDDDVVHRFGYLTSIQYAINMFYGLTVE